MLGLSKVARIRRHVRPPPADQENLTRQIAEAVRQVTNAAGVAVVIEAQHMCMMMRGVEKQNSQMFTSVISARSATRTPARNFSIDRKGK